jgi:hypothetical protein
MEPLSDGITWRQLDEHFDSDAGLSISIKQYSRRTRKPLRRRGQSEERKVWRLVVQKVERCAVKTLFRKNIRYGKDDLFAQPVPPKLLAQINQLIA